MRPENEMKTGTGMKPENAEGNENIQKAFIDYWIRHGYVCDVFVGDNISAQQIVAHRKAYVPMADNERILVLVGDIRRSYDMGLCITDRFVYYKLMPDTFFAPFQKKMKGIVPLENTQENFRLFEAYLRANEINKRWIVVCSVLLVLFIFIIVIILRNMLGPLGRLGFPIVILLSGLVFRRLLKKLWRS